MAGTRKVIKGKKIKRKGATRSHASRVLAQGVGAITKKAFGNSKQKQPSTIVVESKQLQRALNARLPAHPCLPRAVGPYTTVRTTTLLTNSSAMNIFVPFLHNSQYGEKDWLSVVGVRDVARGTAVNGTNNTHFHAGPPPAEFSTAAEVVPAALSVQIMNPGSLETTEGIIAIGRVNQQLNLAHEIGSWDDVGSRFISYYSPRLCSSAKLALRGVRCSAFPLDMSEYADFRTLNPISGDKTWEVPLAPGALSPIVVYQPGTPTSLCYLVTIEWRVRFDPLNPATASHTAHGVTSDGVWAHAIKSMSDMGHGVEDIADSIANIGAAVVDA